MVLCDVIGSVTATVKHAAFEGRKLLVVQPVTAEGKHQGNSFLAVDHTSSAGVGDKVLVMREGGGVRQILKDSKLPIRSLIVGVVDDVSVETNL